MRRILLSLIVLIALSMQAFALENRYFELKYEMPVSVSNTSFFLSDIFKDEWIIDLPAIADSLPKSGFSFDVFARPAVSINVDARVFYLGMKFGTEMQGTTTVSKDIFDFLGKGNSLNQEISIATSLDTDVFFFIDTESAFTIHDFKIKVNPGFFIPIIHTEVRDSNSKIQNTDDGSLKMHVGNQVDLYSPIDTSFFRKLFGEDVESGDFTMREIFGLATLGFDLGGSVQYELFDGFSVRGSFRIPIVPASLKRKMSFGFHCDANINVMNMIKNSDSDDDNDNDNTDGDGEESNNNKFVDFGFDPFTDSEVVNYRINRPLKFMVGVNWDGFGKWLNAYADLGIGVRYPFSKITKPKVYPEYVVGIDLSLFNYLGATFCTQYSDLVFSHKAQVFFNLRVFELDVGISTESPSFISTFKGAGIGIYVATCMGF